MVELESDFLTATNEVGSNEIESSMQECVWSVWQEAVCGVGHIHPSTLLALHVSCGTREWYRPNTHTHTHASIEDHILYKLVNTVKNNGDEI